MRARFLMTALIGAGVLAAHSVPAQAPSTDAQINAIVQSILAQMTLAEKLEYVSGTGAWDIKPLPRLGLPQIKASDAGLGVRLSNPVGVAYPAGPALASTFNADRAKQMGVGLGLETRLSGFQQIAGPGLNMYRTPFSGRAFEYLAGEDPFLGAVLGAAQINGIQSQNVWADAKHYIANEQEVNRFNLMETVSERALREIYMVPFESAVKNANVAVVMCGFQGLNGANPVCESHAAIQQTLKNEWGFKGFVESDYAALKHTLPAAVAGVDIERPSANIFSPGALGALLANEQLSQATLDDKVRRILGRLVAYGFIGGVPAATGESHPPFAERAALDVYGGGGTAQPASVRWTATIRPTVSGAHVFKARANGAVRLYINGQLVMDNGDGNPLPGNVIPPTIPVNARVMLQAGQTYNVQFDYSARPGYIAVFGGFLGAQLSWASLQAPPNLSGFDAVVVAAGHSAEYEGEGFDHPFTLPEFQDELIANLSRANPRTIAVLHGGTGFDMQGWIDGVGAALHAWYPGQNGGQALAEILFGDVNPSGKLPITIERSITDNPTYANYPQASNDLNFSAMTYTEDIFVGYRGFERSGRRPLFPFGFGLSYTRFNYGALSVSPGIAAGSGRVAVSFDITNSGEVAGAEAAQVYVAQSGSAVPRPVKELKGFAKVFLQPGETQRVTVYLDQRSLAYYDAARNAWVTEPGAFDILVGASSQDIRLRGQLLNLFRSVTNTRVSNPLPAPELVRLGPVHP
ncbi:glycoside hydrolase family 3 C-terminal domain-containing protein [Cupriavidus cauae]|uniref:glycoside hydrolase family 3 C-terminal domain-containing protein n=1 Tax=Cupriavidus cauae TaxID=2608999 RepID=UPI002244702F|nr:glycoside hydrolase family 3 C-terminal domain-containing protein [Cupriavidus cauae]UZN51411.1 glycoside hydrolase family 3 C-terminal domain-containing protein [Cupriavidus cauae]